MGVDFLDLLLLLLDNPRPVPLLCTCANMDFSWILRGVCLDSETQIQGVILEGHPHDDQRPEAIQGVVACVVSWGGRERKTLSV